MVNSGGNASSRRCFVTMLPEVHHGVETLMRAPYPPPRFVQHWPPVLTQRSQVINSIRRRVMHVSACIWSGTHIFSNRRALGHTIVRSVLQGAYTESRRDIFMPLLPEDGGSVSWANTIAGVVIAGVAEHADPLLFTSLLSSFLAYGVDFARPRHEHQRAGALDTGIGAPASLPPLDSALWCLHALTVDIFGRIILQLQLVSKRSSDGDSEKNPSTLLHLLLNGHALLSLLLFFAEETTDAAAATGAANPDDASALSSNGINLSDVMPRGDAPIPYTREALYSLFRQQFASSSSIAMEMNRIFNAAVHLLTTMGLKWSLSDGENVEMVRKIYFECNNSLGLGLCLAVQYCRDFPVLCEAVTECGGDIFKLRQLVHSALMTMPTRSREDVERERSVFYSHADAVRYNNRPEKAATRLASGEACAVTPTCSNGAPPVPQSPHWQQQQQLQQQQQSSAAAIPTEPATGTFCHAFIGLYNAGNTCFINSFMQLLFVAKHFRIELVREALLYLEELDRKSSDEPSADDASNTATKSSPCTLISEEVTIATSFLLGQMHWRLRHGYGAVAVDTLFLRSVLPEPLNDGCQHDASECAKVVLEHMDHFSSSKGSRDALMDVHQQQQQELGHEGCTDPLAGMSRGNNATVATNNACSSRKKRVTVVARWFGGLCASMLECQRCHRTRTKLSPFWDISVPLRREGADGMHSDADALGLSPEEGGEEWGRGEPEESMHATDVVRSEDGHVAVTRYNTAAEEDDSDVGVDHNHNHTNDEQNGSNCMQRRKKDKEGETKRTMLHGPRHHNCHHRYNNSSGSSLQQLLDCVLNYRDLCEILEGDNAPYCELCCSRESALLRVAMHATYNPVVGAAGFAAGDGDGDDGPQERRGRRWRHHEEEEEEEEEERERERGEEGVEGVPFYLTLQLNRFQYTRESGQYEKLMDAVRLDEYLDVPVRVVSRPGHPEVSGEEAEGNGNEDEEGEEEEDRSNAVMHRSLRYRLIAVLVHSGLTPRSGHYFSLLRLPPEAGATADSSAAAAPAAAFGGAVRDTCSSWVLANDSVVSPLAASTVEAVLSGSGGVFSHLETPYIILYERCRGSCVSASDDSIVFPSKIEDFFQTLLKNSMPTARTSAEAHAAPGGGSDNDNDDDGAGVGAGPGAGPIY